MMERKEMAMRSTTVGGLIVATLAATACHTMTPLSWSELNALRPGYVYVTRTDQSVVEMSGPQVFGDSLVGYINGQFQEVPTAEIRRVAMKRPARAKTIALIAGSTAAAAAIAVWMAGVGEQDPRFEVDCFDQPLHPDCV
jgi:hypothetical protein